MMPARHLDSQEHIRSSFIEAVPTPMALTDTVGAPIVFSAGWRELFGEDGEELRWPAPLASPLGTALQCAMESGEAQQTGTIEVTSGRLRRRLFDAHVRPWLGPDRSLIGGIVSLRDKTRLRHQEVRISNLRKHVLEINYRSSHDIMAPLRTVQGWVSVAREALESGKPEEVAAALERIEDRCEHLVVLLSNLSAVAETDIRSAAAERISLRPFVAEVVASIEPRASQNSVEIEWSADEVELFARRSEFRKALIALLENGIAFRRPNIDSRIVVRAKATDGWIEVEVADNGVGVPARLRATLFDMFVRGSHSHRGNGLGLYIARRFAVRAGGDLELACPRDDTRFVLQFPLQTEA